MHMIWTSYDILRNLIIWYLCHIYKYFTRYKAFLHILPSNYDTSITFPSLPSLPSFPSFPSLPFPSLLKCSIGWLSSFLCIRYQHNRIKSLIQITSFQHLFMKRDVWWEESGWGHGEGTGKKGWEKEVGCKETSRYMWLCNWRLTFGKINVFM